MEPQTAVGMMGPPAAYPEGDPLLLLDRQPLRQLATSCAAAQPCADPHDAGPATASSGYLQVDVREAHELSHAAFVREYMEPNKPVLIKGVASAWRACEWVDAQGQPDVGALVRLVGANMRVCVTNTVHQESGSGPCEEISLGQYWKWWQQRAGSSSHCSAAGDAASSCSLDQGASSRGGAGASVLGPGVWYLKDWHLVAQAPPGYSAYQTPVYFSSDWLNTYYDALVRHSGASGGTTSDYRFVYLGPAGSWTPLHSDVLRSYSWSTNIAGVKRWLLLHPRHTHMLYDDAMATIAPDFCAPPPSHPAAEHVQQAQAPLRDDPALAARFPRLKHVVPLLYEVIQEAGDALFVPSGWHHTVLNLADTLSINHNWLNAHNCHWTWALLRAQHTRASAMIEDCRQLCSSQQEFEDLVQRNLAADSGLDFKGWGALLTVSVSRALRKLQPQSGSGSTSAACCTVSGTQVAYPLFEVQRVEWVLGELLTAIHAAYGLAKCTYAVAGCKVADGTASYGIHSLALADLDALEDAVLGCSAGMEGGEDGDLQWVLVLQKVHTCCMEVLRANGVPSLTPSARGTHSGMKAC